MDTLTINLIRYSWERILRHPDAMMAFYDKLFQMAPETRRLFQSDIAKQSEKLAYTIAFVVENLDRIDTIKESVEDLGRVHNRMNIQAHHYELVTRALVETIKDVMGADYTEEIGNAWTAALKALAGIMMNAPAERKVSRFKKLLQKLFPEKELKPVVS
jgi:hemoglobin-like flavoprotein